ncbi:MAG: glycosyltransferase [Rhodosalinus sp.]
MVEDRILIYAPVPLYRHEGRTFVEDQAIIGLTRWTENFGLIDAMMPVTEGAPPVGWSPVEALARLEGRAELHQLPMAYRPDRFARHLPATRRRIRALIEANDYLAFSIGGLFGDWGAVAALTAHGMGRRFGVWTDRVESEVVRLGMHDGPWRARLRKRLYHRPMAALERAVIRRATLGLFHGRETYEAYAPFCRESHVVHDIMVSKDDHIPAARRAAKRRDAGQGPLRIAYVGRADEMKGALDWVGVLIRLAEAGVDFTATWLGDGGQRAEMLRRIEAAGLAGRVTAPGFVNDRAQVLEVLRAAQIFLFCHRTPESPRCLIEALFSATPIVGYDGAYARDLVAAHGGGRFVPLGDVEGLARAVTALDADRPALQGLIDAAWADGAPFDDVSVFRHRAELIRRYLGRDRPAQA